MKIAFKCCLFIIGLFVPKLLLPCECPTLELVSKESLAGYNVIFYGKVDSVSNTIRQGKSTAHFLIKEVYKGNVPQQSAIVFDASSDCMMSFAAGEEWLIYASYQRFDELEVSLCGHSRKKVSEDAQDFYQLAAGRSFEEEKDYLTLNLHLQPFATISKINEQQTYFKPHNEQPSAINKLLLLLSSFLIMVFIYFITRKKHDK